MDRSWQLEWPFWNPLIISLVVFHNKGHSARTLNYSGHVDTISASRLVLTTVICSDIPLILWFSYRVCFIHATSLLQTRLKDRGLVLTIGVALLQPFDYLFGCVSQQRAQQTPLHYSGHVDTISASRLVLTAVICSDILLILWFPSWVGLTT